MPRLRQAVPKYRKHKSTGQAVCTINGRDHYLGPFATKASKIEYDRLITEWLSSGRSASFGTLERDEISVNELILAYLKHAHTYYRKDGRLTGEYEALCHAFRSVKYLYGRRPVSEFGPLAAQAVMHKMIEHGLCRGTINRHLGRIKRLFRWGVAQELIDAGISHGLEAVRGLRKGRSAAVETGPVLPIADDVVEATLKCMPDVPADMVRLQLLLGCRPSELTMLRPMDIDRGVDPWRYRPSSHKCEHHDRDRAIFVGPQAQSIISRYLARDAAAFCFQPIDSEQKRRAAVHAGRRVPLSCGNVPGSNRVRRRKRAPGGRYTVDAYRRAIHRAADKAFPAPPEIAKDPMKLAEWRSAHRWAPNRLRHSRGTSIRREYGLEGSQVILGHASANITQVYAERDHALAARIAREVG